MLLTRGRFRQPTTRPIADAARTGEVLICVSADGREGVDATVDRARAAGGGAAPSPKQDRGFEDQDGHIWGAMWMDKAAVAAAVVVVVPARESSSRA